MTKRSWIAAGVLLLSGNAFADDTELAELLDTSVVTTASQSAETSSVAPATSTTITAAQLRQLGIQTLEDAVNFLSLGMTSGGRNFHGRQPELGARGVVIADDRGNHVLLLVNGHHVNEPGSGLAHFGREAGIPLEVVDRIEVIVGPGSVLYGSNAMLGVINVITKQASEYKGVHVVTEVGLLDSVRASVGSGHEFTLFGEAAQLTATVEYFERRGPDFYLDRQRVGVDPFTNEPIRTGPGAAGSLGYWGGALDASNRSRVPSAMMRLQVGDLTLNLHGRLAEYGTPLTARGFDLRGNYVEEQALWADLVYRKVVSPVVEMTARLYGDGFGSRAHSENHAFADCANQAPCSMTGTSVTRWMGLELRASFDWLQDRSFVTTIGIDERIRDVRAKNDLFNLGESRPRNPSQSVLNKQDETLGVYLQQTYRPAQWLAFNLGARVDRDVRFDPVVSPRAAAMAHLWEGATLRGIYSEAFRAPGRLEELSRFDRTGSMAASLEPETVRSMEGSLEQRFGAHRVLIGAFRTKWSDLVQEVVLSDEERAELVGIASDFLTRTQIFTQLRNTSEIDNYGVNVGYRGELIKDRLELGLNLTVAEARQRDKNGTERDLQLPAKVFGNAHAVYSLGERLPTFGLAVSYLDRRLANRAYDGQFDPTPWAPARLDFRATITGDVPLVDGLSYRLIGSHITAPTGAYVIGPVQQATPAEPRAFLDPLKQYEVYWGLQYDFEN